MTLSYNLAYQEIILVHPTRRQIFSGKLNSTLWNIWDLIVGSPTISATLATTRLQWSSYRYTHLQNTRRSWNSLFYEFGFSLIWLENILHKYADYKTCLVNLLIGKYAEHMSAILQKTELVVFKSCRAHWCGQGSTLGCPKKTKSPNFVSQRNPLVFIG